MKRKLLIINKAQFGYQTDSYKYCQYLKEDFEITYICFQNVGEKIYIDGIKVHYINYRGSFIKRGLSLIKYSKKLILKSNFDIIFIVYFQMSSLLRLLISSKIFILDIRSGAVGTTNLKRKIYNGLMKFESIFFNNITIISECLRKKMKLNPRKSHILPIGADSISSNAKFFDKLNLLYVGTLNSRNIDETIVGLSQFISTIKNIDISYDIIGYGSDEHELLLKKVIKEENLNEIVTFHGRKKLKELKPFFKYCNIGVSYVPITDYFSCQPATKTFEYINSGMVCIATNNEVNKELICTENGILCDDTSESFKKGLMEIYLNKENYNSKIIKKTLNLYTWKNICEKNLKPYFLGLLQKQ